MQAKPVCPFEGRKQKMGGSQSPLSIWLSDDQTGPDKAEPQLIIRQDAVSDSVKDKL